jgi:hypothetical protein
LVRSIQKVPHYTAQEAFTPVDVKKKAYPLMNYLVVKMLRDTAHHYKASWDIFR